LTDLSSYKSARGLVETTDPENDGKSLFRRPGFDGIRTFGEMDEIIAAFLKQIREDQGLPRADFAPLVGLSVPVYGRYERAFSRMTVTRMIHLCELLGFMPIDMLFEAAPHLWGRTQEEAEDRRTLTKLIERLPQDTMRDLIRLLQRMVPGEKTADAVASIAGA
jgi:transcriptional regulator with XRE-family HTH domain